MAYPLQAQCNNLSGPWYVDMTDCIYSSLTYFNANTNYFECKIEDLIVKINKSGIRRLIAGDGIILEDISVAGNTIYKISTPQVQLTASTVILSSTSSIAYIDTEPASLIPWWMTVSGQYIQTPGLDESVFPTITSAYYGQQSVDIKSAAKFYFNSDNRGSQNFSAGWYRIRYVKGGLFYDPKSSNFTGTGCNVVYRLNGQDLDTYVGYITHGTISESVMADHVAVSTNPNNNTPTRQLTFYHSGGPIYIYLKDNPYYDNTLSKTTPYPPTWELYGLTGAPLAISQHIQLDDKITNYIQGVVNDNSNIIPTAVSISESKNLTSRTEGSILLQDGRIFIMGSVYPTLESNCKIYNPLNDTVLDVPNNPYKFQQSGGLILMANGCVYIPDQAAQGASIYDPSTNTWSKAAANNTNWTKYSSYIYNGSLLPNGQIYNQSVKSGDYHIIYDPLDDTIYPCSMKTNITGHTCVMLRDGRILKIPNPSDGSRAEIFDWKSNGIVKTCPFPKGSWFTGRLTAEGIVILAPNGKNPPIAYNPYTDSVTTLQQNDWYNNVPANVLNYSGGCLLPDGRLFFAPWSAPYGILYDPYQDTTVRIVKGENPQGSFGGITMMLDGSILLSGNKKTSKILKFHNNTIFEPNLLTSPFFQNKGY